MAKKNITLNKLAERMDKGFTTVNKKIDDLTDITRKSFDEVYQRLEDVDKKLAELRRDMEEVKLKFAYTAWAIDVLELKKRVIVLEKKLSIK